MRLFDDRDVAIISLALGLAESQYIFIAFHVYK